MVALWPTYAAAADPVAGELATPPFHFDVSLEAVILTREHSDNFTILEDTIAATEILGSDDFDFGWEPGVDARAGVSVGQFGIAARFFGGFNWEESESLTTPVIWDLPTTPPLFGLGVADIDADYDSELHTGEIGLTYSPFEQIRLVAGARALVLDESLALDADFGANNATITTTADTFGIGPQLALLVNTNVPGTGFFVDAELRGGYLFTESELDFSVEQAIGPAFVANGDPDGETFFGEGSLAVRYQFNEFAGIRAGYTVLFVDDIPTAPASISGVDVINGTIDRVSDQLIAHGARVGFVGRF
jgi:hypothetical protein